MSKYKPRFKPYPKGQYPTPYSYSRPPFPGVRKLFIKHDLFKIPKDVPDDVEIAPNSPQPRFIFFLHGLR